MELEINGSDELFVEEEPSGTTPVIMIIGSSAVLVVLGLLTAGSAFYLKRRKEMVDEEPLPLLRPAPSKEIPANLMIPKSKQISIEELMTSKSAVEDLKRVEKEIKSLKKKMKK